MKRILTIQDISCVGKCSLTVALPILSAYGLETAVLPTAMLSTHTAFSNYTFVDLSDQIPQISDVWKKQGLTFDGIYTGYLGSVQLINLVEDVIKRFHEEGKPVLIDPAMADNGKLYSGFDKAYIERMREFCAPADIVVPNITEAALLLDRPYQEQYCRDDLEEMLRALRDLGPRRVAITGVSLEKGKLGVLALDEDESSFISYEVEKIPTMFHGTGDIFASCLFGSIVKGYSFEGAIRSAVDFVSATLRETLSDPSHEWYGVNFESLLGGIR